MSRQNSVGDVTHEIVIRGLAGLAILVLLGPVVVVLITSFTDSQSLKFPPRGFSFQWYEKLFDPSESRQIHRAAFNTLEVAAWAAGAAALIGTCAALGITAARSNWSKVADSFFMSPLILPGIAFGLAALMYFSLLGIRPSLTLIMIGHFVMIVPFVLRTTMASLTQLDPSLIECSASLGATRLYTFRRITLPVIMPGIAAGTFMAFMASVDNVPVSLFLSGPKSDMLPIRLWGMMESTLDVRVAAVSGVLIISVLILMLLMERLTGLSQRIKG
jgi:putative spermidine/putrescine transport system permease protein